jgi:phage gpG-like protein
VKFEMTQTGSMLSAILRLKKDLASRAVRVGVMGKGDRERGGVSEDGKTPNERPIGNVELAVIHEYGAPKANVPARSFLYSTLHVNRKAYAALIGQLINGTIQRRFPVEQALNMLGMRVANDAKNRIADGDIKQDLAPSTLARKQAKGAGDVKALIDTGQLKNSITWVVE